LKRLRAAAEGGGDGKGAVESPGVELMMKAKFLELVGVMGPGFYWRAG